MCDNAVNLILYIFVLREDFPFLHLSYDAVDKFKTLPVFRLHGSPVFQIDLRLYVRRFLVFSILACRRFHNFSQPFMTGRSGDGLDDRTAQFLRQQLFIDFRLLFVCDIALIQRHHNRHAQFQKLCGKKQASA